MRAGDQGRSFFAEIVKDLGTHPKLLFCFFASPRAEWGERFPAYSEGFRALLPEGIEPTFELATHEDFAEQMKTCDALYMHGGQNNLIESALSWYDMPALWEGKVVATNSASAMALAVHSWTCDERKCIDGFGVLPIKFIAHYQSDYGSDDPRGPIDWQKAYDDLAAYGDTTLPIHALKEGEYVVIEQ
jgi:hypothetical protein